MAHGYPDYWAQQTPGLPVPGIEQLFWGLSNSLNVAGGATVVLINSVGVAGFVYYITGGVVSSSLPGISRYQESIGLALYPWQYFDTRALLSYNPSALLRLVGVENYLFTVNNLDTVQHTISVQLRGFRVAVVPGVPAPAGIGLAIAGAGV